MGNQQPGGGGGGNAGGGSDPHHQQHTGSNRNDHHQQHQYGGYQQQYQQQQQQQHQSQHQHPTVPSAHPNQVTSGSGGGGYGGYNNQQQVLLSMGGGGDPYGNTTTAPSSINRSNSDASMTIMDNNVLVGMLENSNNANTTNNSNDPQNNNNNPAMTPISYENWLDDDTVPTVFRWEHGGRQVYITGTFNGWSRQIPMHRSGNDFSYIHNLKRGKHAFKFIVDDEWRFAPDQPTVADIEGRINNFIDVTSFKPYTGDKDFEKEKAAAEYGVNLSASTGTALGSIDDPNNVGAGGAGSGGGDSSLEGNSDGPSTLGVASSALAAMGAVSSSGPKPDRDGEIFTTTMPDMDEYTKEPPPLPPHLRHIILNKPPQLSDTAALPVPQHVALNHLYCTAIKDNMMVLGITQRYKTKFVTTVYYSPCGK